MKTTTRSNDRQQWRTNLHRRSYTSKTSIDKTMSSSARKVSYGRLPTMRADNQQAKRSASISTGECVQRHNPEYQAAEKPSGRLALPALVLGLFFLSSCETKETLSIPQPLLPYHGRYAEDPRITELAFRVVHALEPAADRISRNLGLSINPRAFRYRLRDTPSDQRLFQEHWARTLHVGRGLPATIEVAVEPFLLNITDIVPVLAHEIAHACLERELDGSYQDLPRWLQEGLAVYAAEQTEDKVLRVLRWSERKDPSELIDGLDETDHTWSDYAEDGLAIESIIQLGGDDAVLRLIRKLAEHSDWKIVLEEITGVHWSDFSRRAAEQAAAFFSRRAGRGGNRYHEGRVLFSNGDYRLALETLDTLAQGEETAFRLPAVYYSAHARLALGDFSEAESLFRMAMDSRELPPRYYSAALFGSFQALSEMGVAEVAGKRCRAYLTLATGNDSQKRICRAFIDS